MSEHETKVRNFFAKRVADYDAFYEPASPLHRGFNRVFRRAVYLRRDNAVALAERYGCKTMLDVGCGSGQNAVWFVRHGIEHVVGVDISGEMVDQARRLAERAGVADRCEFQHVEFTVLPTDRTFDLVVALGVFDYVEDATGFLRHMSRFADKVVYGSFPGWTMIRSPLRKLRYALRNCPTHFYRRDELQALFDAVAFGPVELKRVPSGHLAWAAANRVHRNQQDRPPARPTAPI
jgi:ubiquinone/menaquinone biosynthesis C-methylase UbiE